MNEDLAAVAIKAVTDPAFERRKGFCSRFVREVVASVYGDRYADVFGRSALATADDFSRSGLTVEASATPDPGDILFKTSVAGPFGHACPFLGRRLNHPSDSPIAPRQSTAYAPTPYHHFPNFLYKLKTSFGGSCVYGGVFKGSELPNADRDRR